MDEPDISNVVVSRLPVHSFADHDYQLGNAGGGLVLCFPGTVTVDFGEGHDDLTRKVALACRVHDDLVSALEEIVDYRGGADNALEDPYVMDRACAAIAKAKGGQP